MFLSSVLTSVHWKISLVDPSLIQHDITKDDEMIAVHMCKGKICSSDMIRIATCVGIYN